MSMVNPSQAVLDELDTLLDSYLRLFPNDRLLTAERYFAFLQENASAEAYAYVKDASQKVELIKN